jgi:hypothetical protein
MPDRSNGDLAPTLLISESHAVIVDRSGDIRAADDPLPAAPVQGSRGSAACVQPSPEGAVNPREAARNNNDVMVVGRPRTLRESPSWMWTVWLVAVVGCVLGGYELPLTESDYLLLFILCIANGVLRALPESWTSYVGDR